MPRLQRLQAPVRGVALGGQLRQLRLLSGPLPLQFSAGLGQLRSALAGAGGVRLRPLPLGLKARHPSGRLVGRPVRGLGAVALLGLQLQHGDDAVLTRLHLGLCCQTGLLGLLTGGLQGRQLGAESRGVLPDGGLPLRQVSQLGLHLCEPDRQRLQLARNAGPVGLYRLPLLLGQGEAPLGPLLAAGRLGELN